MNAVTRKMIMMFGPMLLKGAINSMLEEKKLVEYKEKVISLLHKLTGKTETKIDDSLIDGAIKIIMDPLTYKDGTKEFCSMVRQYIVHTETEWDDIVFLPILDRVERIGTGK